VVKGGRPRSNVLDIRSAFHFFEVQSPTAAGKPGMETSHQAGRDRAAVQRVKLNTEIASLGAFFENRKGNDVGECSISQAGGKDSVAFIF